MNTFITSHPCSKNLKSDETVDMGHRMPPLMDFCLDELIFKKETEEQPFLLHRIKGTYKIVSTTYSCDWLF